MLKVQNPRMKSEIIVIGSEDEQLDVTNKTPQPGLWYVLRETYHGRYRDPTAEALSDRAGTAFFWYIAISEMYTLLVFIVPTELALYGETVCYCVKVACWFAFVQIVANWTCIRYIATNYRVTEDQPDQLLDRPLSYNQSATSGWSKCNGVLQSKSRYSDIFPHQVIERRTVTDTAVASFAGEKVNDCRTTTPTLISSVMSWQWCAKCQHHRPPRSHHCVVCKKCILKRDHHCYITGRCIGLKNQRHFVVMNFYIAVATLAGLYYELRYLKDNFCPRKSYYDYILPVTVYHWLFSAIADSDELTDQPEILFHHLVMLSHMYTLWWIGLCALMFVIWQFIIIAMGVTSFEFRKQVPIRSTSTVAEHFRSVFGPLWLTNFLFPAHIVFQQVDDGIKWCNIKPSGRQS